jgi:hypothetical protein
MSVLTLVYNKIKLKSTCQVSVEAKLFSPQKLTKNELNTQNSTCINPTLIWVLTYLTTLTSEKKNPILQLVSDD